MNILREYEDKDFCEVINVAYKHLGINYVNILTDYINTSSVYVLETNLGIRSFILYKEDIQFNILAFTDIFDEFTFSTYRKFREIIQNRNNTILIQFSNNKEILTRAIKPYGGYVVYNVIVVPKRITNE
jgi:hypothetical protein